MQQENNEAVEAQNDALQQQLNQEPNDAQEDHQNEPEQQQLDDGEGQALAQDDGQAYGEDVNQSNNVDGGAENMPVEQYEAMLNQRPSFPGADPMPGQQPIEGIDDSQNLGQDPNVAAQMQQMHSDEQQPMMDQNLNNFTEDEINNLRSIFEMFDPNKTGAIEVKDLETIMGSLQRDANEVRDFVDRLDPNSNGRISFEEFLELMQQIENKIVKDNSGGDMDAMAQQQMMMQQEQMMRDGSSRGMINVTADSKVLDFLRLLEEYRRKCEEQGNYAEARKSRTKFDELLKKETQRQRNNIKAAQEQELQNIESAQKAQFLEFSQAWDNYMSDYEATAYLSLEKLKEKHMLEFQQFQDKIRRELRARMKFSKDLLELRDKEAKLVRMKRYEEAEKVKMKADLLEEFERNKLEAEMQAVIQKKEAKLRHQQQLALAALLKRIQRDRNEQLKHRQQDSQRLIQRNKNILNDLLNKQNAETKRTLENLKQTLGMTRLDKISEFDAQSHPKQTMRLPSSQYSKKRSNKAAAAK